MLCVCVSYVYITQGFAGVTNPILFSIASLYLPSYYHLFIPIAAAPALSQ